mgnify:CR=1 FL=1
MEWEFARVEVGGRLSGALQAAQRRAPACAART